ncbi:MAG: caspase family protein [Gemmatimonadota bacterium]|nr:caspase family protein [Gemmatimonadota bacterium]
MFGRVLALMMVLCVLIVQDLYAVDGVRRWVLAVGANDGGAKRETLQYAVSDAQNFVQVMETMGGVDAGVLLSDPHIDHLEEALYVLHNRVASAEAARREVLIYYSGHADENGLRLGESLFSYARLRNAMDRMEAEVHIAILDACASGAITRLKGGRRQKAFMVDASSDMRGYAFLTSSSEDEAAQESDAIGASFFSHYLVSGLRGAADVTGDGRVTLNEAYHFAFQNTLEGTERTRGGAQHPAYDIKMTGTGDVVMTDVRQTSAGLILAEALQGRFFIRNANRQLIAELFKPAGRRVELGLEPGTYRVHMAREIQSATASVELAMGQREILDEAHFEIIARERTTIRGGIKYSVKRSRIELRGGYWNPGGESNTGGLVRQSIGSGWLRQRVENMMGSIAYTYQLKTDLALIVRWAGLIAEVEQNVGVLDTSQSVVIITPLLFGVRYYWPLTPSPFRPYVVASAGPYFLQDVWQNDQVIWQDEREDDEEDDREYTGLLVQEVKAQATIGTYVGGGIDFAIGRYLMLGASAGYHLIANFAEPIRGRKNFSGPELSFSLSLLWGKDVGKAKSIRR